MSKRPLFEVCLQSPQDVINAEAGGADRVELCAALAEGGLTPDLAAVELALDRSSIPIMAMVRPRAGDFLYSALEFEQMLATVRTFRELGVHGVVFGALDADGSVARTRVRQLVEEAGDLETTFHRAFDVASDLDRALDDLIALGLTRVLTSGGKGTVPEGADTLARLIDRAGDDIIVMPGCGITPENLLSVLYGTGAREFHATAFVTESSAMQHRNEEVYMGVPGLPEYERQVTSAGEVRRFVDLLDRT